MKWILIWLLAFATWTGLADDHVYQGHYASGISKWTVKGAHVYQGHYASGISKWTTGVSSGVLHVYEGHYASGISKWTYKDGHLYQGHYASGISKWTYKDGHVYQGHYASGISKFTFRNGHVYRGHYASGISAWTFGSTAEVPDGLLVFLVTQVLEPAGTESGTVAGGTGGAPELPPVVRPPVIEPPVIQPQPSRPAAPAQVWSRARTLRGVYREGGVVVAVAEVKCGKADRKGFSRISAAISPFIGRRRSFKAQKVQVAAGATPVAWAREGLEIEIGDAGAFAGRLGAGGVLASAGFGGFPAGRHRLSVVPEGPRGVLPGYGLDESALPSDVSFTAEGGRWTFAKGEPSKVRLSYAPATGLFKGAFKASYAPDAPKKRARTVSVKVAGAVVDGVGVGAASCSRPAQAYAVSVD